MSLWSLLAAGTLAAQAPTAPAGGRVPMDTVSFPTALSAPYWSLLGRIACPAAPWTPRALPADLNAPERLRAAFRARLGPLQDTTRGSPTRRTLLYDGPTYRVEVVVLTHRLPGALTYGLYASPKNRTGMPAVVLLPGAGTTGRQAFGWRTTGFDPVQYPDAPIDRLGLDLVERGFHVFTPFIRNDQLDFWPFLWWTSLEHQGRAYNTRAGGTAYGLVIDQLRAALDFLHGESGIDPRRIAAVGWEEGADFATSLAILDRRVTSVVRLMPPLDTRRWRSTPAGMMANAALMGIDCTFGEAEQLAMLAPTPVRYDWSPQDPTFARHRFFVDSLALTPGRRIYQAIGRPRSVSFIGAPVPPSVRATRIAEWIQATAPGAIPNGRPTGVAPPTPLASVFVDLRNEIVLSWDEAINRAGTCARPTTLLPDPLDRGRFAERQEEFRRIVARTIRAPIRFRHPYRVLVRDTIEQNDRFTLEWIYTTQTEAGVPLAGFLATPRDTTTLHPALLTFDGDFFAGEPFGLPPRGNSVYLKAYARRAAEQGIIVFAPHIPAWFGEGGVAAMAARDPYGPNFWTVALSQFHVATDFLLAVPHLDTTKVTSQGISLAGMIALYGAATEPRITRLVFSNPVNTADTLFAQPFSVSLAAWYNDICGTLDDVRRYLIAPRPFLWENGVQDDNGFEGTPLEMVSEVRRTYEMLGIGDRFIFLRHPGGHEEAPEDIRRLDFYRRDFP